MSEYGLIVIGGGLSGIAFARFYLDIHPKASLLMLEKGSGIGGVWSAARSFDGFWSQSGLRMAGFSDIPISLPQSAPTYWDTFPAKYMTKYLEDYVDQHVYNGEPLRSRVLCSHTVETVTKDKSNRIWMVSARGPNQKVVQFRSPKLVVASGHTSIPRIPTLPHQEAFSGPVYHHVDFGKISQSLMTNARIKHIVVLGGGKSAADMVYVSAHANKTVSWVIRAKGEGPALFYHAGGGGGRYRNSTEKGATRFNAMFGPSSFMPDTVVARLLHSTTMGKNYIANRIAAGDQATRDAANFDREDALPGYKNLEGSTSAFWCNGPLGMVQHDDFWDTMALKVRIYREDIRSLAPNSVMLCSGESVPADAILCGTGWKADYPFLSPEVAKNLGIPHDRSLDSLDELAYWDSIIDAADQEILQRFPLLKNPPPHENDDRHGLTTARLYNCIAPVGDQSVAFLGHMSISNSFRAAEVQAIWATAYFDEKLRLPPPEAMRTQIATMNAFSKRRYPSHGATGDFLFFELIWYTDKLLQEVGITSHRAKSWWEDLMEPCLQSDLSGARDEYKALHRA